MSPRTCACGYTRNHPHVQQEPQYSLWGWIMLSMFGVTPVPKYIDFRCIRCKRSLGTSRDPKLLHKRQLPTEVVTTPYRDAAADAPKTDKARDDL